jgi:CDP-glucose 4,6-dehydratase
VAVGRGALARLDVSAALLQRDFWRGRRVLLTGHTGFKGAWLGLWLQSLGAEVHGFSRDVPTVPSLYELARVGEGMRADVRADVRDFDALASAFAEAGAEVVIHMAAQAFVRRSFAQPRETYETNVMGTVNVLEAARLDGRARVIVNVTSDKCYENREWEWAYREEEPMGGFDPYSSSKGCAELVTAAYRRSFLSDSAGPRLASARAGNVIGGGDWGEDRLLPDVMRAALAGETVLVRSPDAVRPWQHVLNPLSGYLVLAQALWENPAHAGAWNFGPPEEEARAVRWLVERVRERFAGELRWKVDERAHPHEAHHLKVDSSRARTRLGWRPCVDLETALASTVAWYEHHDAGADMRAVTLAQIAEAERVGVLA